jgi:phosphohistidine phosphatase
MTRELLLLRHAKSSWTSDAGTDFDRPLSRRGEADAPQVGRWLRRQGLVPDHVISSPARRARQTARRVCHAAGFDRDRIAWEPRVYEAELGDLLAVLAEAPARSARVLLVGHNPGLERLLAHLWGEGTGVPEDGKLLPTASVARLEMSDDWTQLDYGAARLLSLTRVGQTA